MSNDLEWKCWESYVICANVIRSNRRYHQFVSSYLKKLSLQKGVTAKKPQNYNFVINAQAKQYHRVVDNIIGG